jgi:hypothetical protein
MGGSYVSGWRASPCREGDGEVLTIPSASSVTGKFTAVKKISHRCHGLSGNYPVLGLRHRRH